MIVTIGNWVVEEACRQFAASDADRHIRLSVNIAGCQLTGPGLAEVVSTATHTIGATRLQFEVAAPAAIEGAYSPTVIRNLAALKRLKVGITVDHLGAAQSSLSDVLSLPIDELKLDRSLVANLGKDHATEVISAVVAMARSLNVPVVAVGVETDQQATACRQLGCDRAQGFYFARPQHPDEVPALIS